MKNGIVLKIVVAIIFILAIVGIYLVVTGGEDKSPEMADAANYMVTLALVLLSLVTIFAVVSSIIGMIMNPSAIKTTLIGLAVFAVLLTVAYFAAQDAQVLGASKEALLDPKIMSPKEIASTSKWSGTGLNLSLILLFIGGAMFVFDMVKGLIKS